MWLGNDYAGDHAFKGRTTEYYQIDIPMKDVATHDKQDLTIQKDGTGRLYYRDRHELRAGEPQARRRPTTASSSSARYEGVDDPKDVTRDARRHVAHQGGRARARAS